MKKIGKYVYHMNFTLNHYPPLCLINFIFHSSHTNSSTFTLSSLAFYFFLNKESLFFSVIYVSDGPSSDTSKMVNNTEIKWSCVNQMQMNSNAD